jgi:Ca-activated chloride channel family protein
MCGNSSTVNAVTAKVEAPATAKKDMVMSVKWEGPGHESDFITIARLDQGPGSYVNMAWVVDGNPAQLKAPSEPGNYEVRYIMGEGEKLLAKVPVTIIP